MLKLLRDQFEDWKWACSYYLKTAVMLKIKEDGICWSDKQLGEKFEKMLKVLQTHFKRERLPLLHDSELNLLEHHSGATLVNAERRLSKFIGTDETLEIVDKLEDLLNKSVKQQIAAKIQFTSGTIVPGEVSVENEWHNNSELEDLLEEAFPYEHLEKEILATSSSFQVNENVLFPFYFAPSNAVVGLVVIFVGVGLLLFYYQNFSQDN